MSCVRVWVLQACSRGAHCPRYMQAAEMMPAGRTVVVLLQYGKVASSQLWVAGSFGGDCVDRSNLHTNIRIYVSTIVFCPPFCWLASQKKLLNQMLCVQGEQLAVYICSCAPVVHVRERRADRAKRSRYACSMAF